MLYKFGLLLGRLAYANKGEPYDDGDVEVYAYGFEMFWENFLSLGLMLIIGIWIGYAYETALFLSAFLSMRSSAGGYHAKTSGRCFLCSLTIYAVFLLAISIMPLWLVIYSPLFCVCLSICPIWKFAPFRDDEHTPLGERLNKIMRKRTIAIFIIQAAVIAVLSGITIISNFVKFPIIDIIPYLCLSIALGLLTSALSLVAAKMESSDKRI